MQQQGRLQPHWPSCPQASWCVQAPSFASDACRSATAATINRCCHQQPPSPLTIGQVQAAQPHAVLAAQCLVCRGMTTRWCMYEWLRDAPGTGEAAEDQKQRAVGSRTGMRHMCPPCEVLCTAVHSPPGMRSLGRPTMSSHSSAHCTQGSTSPSFSCKKKDDWAGEARWKLSTAQAGRAASSCCQLQTLQSEATECGLLAGRKACCHTCCHKQALLGPRSPQQK